MPTVGFTRLSADTTHEQLVEIVAYQNKLLEYLFSTLDTKNIREVGGWAVSPTELKSKDGDVGMSTADTGGDDVRYWAGNVNKDIASFIVRKSGKVSATGAEIQSASGYPKVVLDPDENLLGAYSDADSYIAIIPDRSGVPTLVLVDGDQTKGFLNKSAGGVSLGTFDGEPLIFQSSAQTNLSPDGNLQINGTNGYTGNITYVKSVVDTGMGIAVSTGSINFYKGIVTGAT